MGLTGLQGGGIPPFAVDVTSTGAPNSTTPPAPLGTVAVGQNGERYVLGRVGSTTQAAGSVVILNSSIGKMSTILLSTAATISTGGSLGVAQCTASSTDQYAWYQTYGLCNVLGDSTAGAAGVRLWQSTTVAGAVHGSSGGAGITGIQTTSSGTSSFWPCFLSDPAFTNFLS